jgi:hypothetical protein
MRQEAGVTTGLEYHQHRLHQPWTVWILDFCEGFSATVEGAENLYSRATAKGGGWIAPWPPKVWSCPGCESIRQRGA